jgi:hypothetical protein
MTCTGGGATIIVGGAGSVVAMGAAITGADEKLTPD